MFDQRLIYKMVNCCSWIIIIFV